MHRRRYLATSAAALGAGVAGCLGEDEPGDEPDENGDPDTDRSPTDQPSTGENGAADSDAFELPGEDALPVPVLGDPDADVTVTVFEDFGCPHCARFTLDVFPELEDRYVEPGEIGYEHRDFPIPVQEPWSWDVASAARSVQDRAGDEAFFAFAEAMYAAQGDGYTYAVIERAAADLDADVDAAGVRADAEEGRFREELETERQRGIDAGIQGTPTTVVDGEVVESSLDALATAIDAALGDGDDGSADGDTTGVDRA